MGDVASITIKYSEGTEIDKVSISGLLKKELKLSLVFFLSSLLRVRNAARKEEEVFFFW